MAWNGSNQSSQSPNQSINRKIEKSKNLSHGLLAGLIVVVGLLATLFFLRDSDSEESAEQPRDQAPVEIATVAHTTNRVETVAAPAPTPVKTRPTKIGETVNGYVMLRDGTIRHRENVITNSAASRMKGWYTIFKHNSDNQIALYLTLEPGAQLLGNRTFDGFKKRFLASLEDPIEISDDDSPQVAQLKRDVIETRKQLKDALDRGEDIEQIMRDTRNELQELGRVKQELHKLFLKERKQCETDADVEDLLGACNKMLEEKGIAPLTCTPVTRRNILRSERGQTEQ